MGCFDRANRFTNGKDADRHGQIKSSIRSKQDGEIDRHTDKVPRWQCVCPIL